MSEKMKLSGSIIKRVPDEHVSLQSQYFDFLEIDLDLYKDVDYTREEATYIKQRMQHLSTGASAALPLICKGPACPFSKKCPFVAIDERRKEDWKKAKEDGLEQFTDPPRCETPVGKSCHPPGEQVLTYDHGYINIEELNPDVHRVIGYERHHNCVRKGKDSKGYGFKKAERQYCGNIVTLETNTGKRYKCTEDHICIVRFNENAVGKFCVYLMRKGIFWRIGKTKILGRYNKENRFGHKTFLGFTGRGNTEEADAMWILGIYDTNTEASLQEDYFSCLLSTSKVLFQSTSDGMTKKKWDGLYAWATQAQLDQHHMGLVKPESFYREKLAILGLSIDYPIWTPNNNSEKSIEKPEDTKIKAKNGMYIRACNIISNIMDVPVYPQTPQIYGKDKQSSLWVANWETVRTNKETYRGLVYSLEVERHNTYFVNGIATHNCLVEVNLLNEWTRIYIQEFDAVTFVDLGMCRELGEIEVMLWRINNGLAKEENAELMQQTVVGADKQGNPLIRLENHTLLDAREKMVNRKSKLIKLMVGDRQEKYKKEAALKQRDEKDPSSSAAQLRGQITRLVKEASARVLKLAEIEGNVIDVNSDTPKQLPETITPESLIDAEGEEE